jgi:phosphate starvation-inducible protein PhoH and related proteins
MDSPLIKEYTLTNEEAQIIYGKQDENLEFMEDLLEIEIFARGNKLKLKGDRNKVEKAARVIDQLKQSVLNKKSLSKSEILKIKNEGEISLDVKGEKKEILVNSKKKLVFPKTPVQQTYIESIKNYDLTLGIGPAGTGKTYLAVACAIEAVKQGEYQRVILTRPALESGEKLGFLPGYLEEKIKPYLQPIYDALYDIMKYEELKKWTERKIIEIVPLAYMRGRTLREAFIILDEAQNTTFEQMKMFLTRLGVKSKAVITGDTTQIDLPLTSHSSGLVEIEKVLSNLKGINFVYFSDKDVVRHPLVKTIINAYDKHYKKKGNTDSGKKRTEEEKG